MAPSTVNQAAGSQNCLPYVNLALAVAWFLFLFISNLSFFPFLRVCRKLSPLIASSYEPLHQPECDDVLRALWLVLWSLVANGFSWPPL